MITTKIKKAIALVSAAMIISVICSFTGCTSDEPKKDVNGNSQTATASETSGEQKFALNETAVFDNIKVTATELKNSSGNEIIKPESGNVFVGIKFAIENTSSEDQTISSLMLFDAYIDGVKSEYSFNANTAFAEGTLDGSISAGKKMIGYYAVEAKKGWKEISLEVKSDWLSDSKAEFVFENK